MKPDTSFTSRPYASPFPRISDMLTEKVKFLPKIKHLFSFLCNTKTRKEGGKQADVVIDSAPQNKPFFNIYGTHTKLGSGNEHNHSLIVVHDLFDNDFCIIFSGKTFSHFSGVANASFNPLTLFDAKHFQNYETCGFYTSLSLSSSGQLGRKV